MKDRPKENQLGGYIAGVIFGGGLLYVMNNLPAWKVPFLLGSYGEILWAVNLSLTIQLGLNVALMFYHPLYFHYLGQAIMSAAGALALLVVAQVFPIDLSMVPGLGAFPWINLVARVALIAAAFGSAVGAVVNLVRFFARVFKGEVES